VESSDSDSFGYLKSNKGFLGVVGAGDVLGNTNFLTVELISGAERTGAPEFLMSLETGNGCLGEGVINTSQMR
jgi:hypothetical protein